MLSALRPFSLSRGLPLLAAIIAIASGCGGDDKAAAPNAEGSVSGELVVRAPTQVAACLRPQNLDPTRTEVGAASWWEAEMYRQVDDPVEMPEAELDSWEWEDWSLVAFYATPQGAKRAQDVIAQDAKRAGFDVTRTGSVLRVDTDTPDAAAVAALEDCLRQAG